MTVYLFSQLVNLDILPVGVVCGVGEFYCLVPPISSFIWFLVIVSHSCVLVHVFLADYRQSSSSESSEEQACPSI